MEYRSHDSNVNLEISFLPPCLFEVFRVICMRWMSLNVHDEREDDRKNSYCKMRKGRRRNERTRWGSEQ